MDVAHIIKNEDKKTSDGSFSFISFHNMSPLYKNLITTTLGLLMLTLGTGAGLVLVQQNQDVQTGATCNADAPGTNYGSPCAPEGAVDCGGDGKETVCTNGTWHATGNCCGSGGSEPAPAPDTSGNCPSGQWSCGSACADSATQTLFNNTWCDGQTRWLFEAGNNQNISCGGSASSLKSNGCDGSTGGTQPPDGGSTGSGWTVSCANGQAVSTADCSVHQLFNDTWGDGCNRWQYEACRNQGSTVVSGACGACSGGGGTSTNPTPPPTTSSCNITSRSASFETTQCTEGSTIKGSISVTYTGNCSGVTMNSYIVPEGSGTNNTLAIGTLEDLRNVTSPTVARSNVSGTLNRDWFLNYSNYQIIGLTVSSDTSLQSEWKSGKNLSCTASEPPAADCTIDDASVSMYPACFRDNTTTATAKITYKGNCSGYSYDAKVYEKWLTDGGHEQTSTRGSWMLNMQNVSTSTSRTQLIPVTVSSTATKIWSGYTVSNSNGQGVRAGSSATVGCQSIADKPGTSGPIIIGKPAQESIADLDGDSNLNIADYNQLVINWKAPVTDQNAKVDINKDGVINALDYVRFLEEWNRIFEEKQI